MLEAPPLDGAPPVAVPQLLGVQGCVQQVGTIVIPIEEAAAGLPPGFAPAPADPQGATAAVNIWAYACDASLTSAEGAPQDGPAVAEVLGILAVVPPAEFASADASFHAVILGVITNSNASADAYRAWGVQDVLVANVTQSDVVADPNGIPLSLPATPASRYIRTVGGDDTFEIRFNSAFAGPAGAGAEAAKSRLFAVDFENATLSAVLDRDRAAAEGSQADGAAAVRFYGSGGPAPGTVPDGVYAGVSSLNWGATYGWTLTLAPWAPGEGASADAAAPGAAGSAPLV